MLSYSHNTQRENKDLTVSECKNYCVKKQFNRQECVKVLYVNASLYVCQFMMSNDDSNLMGINNHHRSIL